MSKYDELKKLAEAFPSGLDWDSNTEPFFNGPTGESLGGGSDGTYTVYGMPFRLEGEDYDYDGPTYVERCNVEFAKFMVAARDGVLELIAENERLEGWKQEALGVLGPVLDYAHGLKIANLGQSVTQALIDDHQRLNAEVEALKADAERYRFARHIDNDMIMLSALQRVSGDALDEVIDAAMQEASHV
ncbi:hypothetical protein [Stutzerimonas stutzeri]|uniref:hypothetical protein n=1 Tax=Stutzerimonas stutzeri TaxID=316 RepID=UPI003722D48F